MSKTKEEDVPKKITDIDALQSNIESAVMGFAARWISMPGFGDGVEVMGVSQLRDAMGLRATSDVGDPWPTAEQLLLQSGFCWHWLGSQRVMFLMEKDGYSGTTAMAGGDGWDDADEWED